MQLRCPIISGIGVQLKTEWPSSCDRNIQTLKELDIEADFQTHLRSLDDILNLARRYGLSSYDASYLELALRENLPLATLDEDLIKSAEKVGIKIYYCFV